MRVLIVEDEFLVAIDLASIVESIGHEVVGPVQSARSAIDLARTRPVDVALLDVNLGTVTAAPVADVLDKQGVPYVIVTAYGREHLARRFQDTARIPKPSARPTSSRHSRICNPGSWRAEERSHEPDPQHP
jgi:DNA-binding NarL/FixJ family response regulator